MIVAQSVTKTAIDSTEKKIAVIVSLKNGNEYIGVILNQTKDEIILDSQKHGEISIKWQDISSITDINKEDIDKKGRYYEYNLQSTRYFFGPNGFGLKKGEGYYQNVWIFFNQASYGITEYFSMSAGIVPAFLIAGTPTPAWVVPKFSIPIKKDFFTIGVGGLFGAIIGDGTTFGIGFGSFTLGNRNYNLSFSLGFGMVDGEWSSNPVMTLSGMARVSRKTYLLTENYFFPDNLTLLSFGARSFAGRVGIDYGLFLPMQVDIFIAIPWLGVTIPFGKY